MIDFLNRLWLNSYADGVLLGWAYSLGLMTAGLVVALHSHLGGRTRSTAKPPCRAGGELE